MADLWQYSSDKFNVNYLGLDLTPGLVDGSSITWRTSAPDVSFRKNGLGGGIYVWSSDRSGEVDCFIHAASPTHQKLLALYIGIRAAKIIQGPLIVNDLWNKQNTILSGAIPLKMPDESRGTELGAVVWTFAFANRLTIPNLLNRNAVVTLK